MFRTDLQLSLVHICNCLPLAPPYLQLPSERICNCLGSSVKLSVPSARHIHTRTGGLTMRLTGRATVVGITHLPSIAEDSKACDTKGDGTYGKMLLRLASLLCASG